MASLYKSKSFWLCLFSGALLPLIYIVWAAVNNKLGAEPAKALVEFLGETALMFLIATLSISPMQKLKVFNGLVRHRRMLGLYVFFYACLHVFSYGFFLVDWQNLIEDIYKRPYVTMGFMAFVILTALALTSPKIMLRRMGRRWKPLHRLVYLAAIFVLIHVFWQVRSDYSEALIYAVFVLGLLLFRYRYFRGLFSK